MGGFVDGMKARLGGQMMVREIVGSAGLAATQEEDVEGFAWTPRMTKSVEQRRSYARLMLGFSRERLENEFGREREGLAAFNEENGLLQGFYSPGGIRVRFGRSVRVSGT
ncbi:hypothetical protein E3N88_29769 [Mikania micrantha]|uniref:Uncharacterized protein n=1 Tax=Mikania micrantha TaxID=192012 RepID=A0A5N6MKD8_9ASTR|nr:hypothetical protein E3N88_29769 [Mikania micrantha]